MKKTIELTIEQAREMFKKDPLMDSLLIANFTKEELEKKNLPKSWEDLGSISGSYITSDAYIRSARPIHSNAFTNRNIFCTGKQAKSALAMAQLSQLMAVYNDGWVADWRNFEDKYFIIREYLLINTYKNKHTYHFLSFKTAEIRDEFLKNFKPLIKEYFELD